MLRDVSARKLTVKPCSSLVSDCQICLENMNTYGCELQCGHVFHGQCFHTWMKTRFEDGHEITCPLCRDTVNIMTVEPVSIRMIKDDVIQTDANIETQPEEVEIVSTVTTQVIPPPPLLIIDDLNDSDSENSLPSPSLLRNTTPPPPLRNDRVRLSSRSRVIARARSRAHSVLRTMNATRQPRRRLTLGTISSNNNIDRMYVSDEGER